VTEKKPMLEFVGLLGEFRPRLEVEECAAATPSGIDPCSSAGLD
jgi:hypothetical protein